MEESKQTEKYERKMKIQCGTEKKEDGKRVQKRNRTQVQNECKKKTDNLLIT
jgi:hypothetical protein